VPTTKATSAVATPMMAIASDPSSRREFGPKKVSAASGPKPTLAMPTTTQSQRRVA
jgi:hypothetical protein